MKIYWLPTLLAAVMLTACGGGDADPSAKLEALNNAGNANAEPTVEELAAENNTVQVDDIAAYGEVITGSGAMSLTSFNAAMAEMDSMNCKIAATVNSVCQKKGCWMKVDLGEDKEMMVRFKDYGFFVPMDIEGETVVMQGKAYWYEMSVEELQHYAEDAGSTAEEIAAITEPEMALAFEAVGVLKQ